VSISYLRITYCNNPVSLQRAFYFSCHATGKSGQGKTTLINDLLAATQVSAYTYSHNGKQRTQALRHLNTVRATVRQNFAIPSAGAPAESYDSTTTFTQFFEYANAVAAAIDHCMHEAAADLLNVNKEDLLVHARHILHWMHDLQLEFNACSPDNEVWTTTSRAYANMLTELRALDVYAVAAGTTDALVAATGEDSQAVTVHCATAAWLDDETNARALEAAKAQKDTFTDEMHKYAVRAKVPKEPFLLVTPPSTAGGGTACTFLNTEVSHFSCY
jgi:hypothetical protein